MLVAAPERGKGYCESIDNMHTMFSFKIGELILDVHLKLGFWESITKKLGYWRGKEYCGGGIYDGLGLGLRINFKEFGLYSCFSFIDFNVLGLTDFIIATSKH